MNIVEKLDLAIKVKERKTTAGAYMVPYNGGVLHKTTYMMNEEWKVFEEYMKNNQFQPTAYAEYCEGDGGELSEKNGRPPKMASFGSSSRMIYMLSCGKKGFHYEKKLPTMIGGTANLDGFYEDADRCVFVEAKCHEPYSVKKNVVSTCYAKLYEYINERMADSINIQMEMSKCGRYMTVEYSADGKKLERFDMKQMICHLLGIATGIIKGTLDRKQTDFIYLLYDPTGLEIEPEAKAEIDKIYKITCEECRRVDFAQLFRVILEFLSVTKFNGALSSEEMDDIILKFAFILASQDSYKTFLS